MLSHEQESALADYVSTGHRSTPGWLWQSAAYITAILGMKQLEDDLQGNLGEIGVWQGRYLYLLGLLSRDDEKIVGIDSFVHSPDPVAFAKRVEDQFANGVNTSGKLTLIKEDSTKLSPQRVDSLASGKFRLFSVDGGHLADEVLSDSNLVSQMMVPGGIMILDDILNSTCPGVIEGTLDFLKSEQGSQFAAFCLVGNKLLVTDKESAEGYRKHLLDVINANKEISLFRDTAQTISDFPNGVYPRLCGSDLIVITWSGDYLISDNGVPVLIRTKVCDMSEMQGHDVYLPSVVDLAHVATSLKH
ncbi:MAG: class I SAM-dependent methyltransferase [Rubripirellula sp.]